MVNKPFERRSLLRGAGALTAASLAPWAAGCAADDDDALTFFLQPIRTSSVPGCASSTNSSGAIPISRYGPCCPDPASCSSSQRFARVASVGCADGMGTDLCRTGRPGCCLT